MTNPSNSIYVFARRKVLDAFLDMPQHLRIMLLQELRLQFPHAFEASLQPSPRLRQEGEA
jgi:hypothetical protein